MTMDFQVRARACVCVSFTCVAGLGAPPRSEEARAASRLPLNYGIILAAARDEQQQQPWEL